MAITSQENATTKKEVTELRLSLNESCRENVRLQAQVDELKKIKDELDSVRLEKERLEEQSRVHEEKARLSMNEKQHEATMELVKEGYDLQVERLRRELEESRDELTVTKKDLNITKGYLSDVLAKYYKRMDFNSKKISELHDILCQNNIPLPRTR